MEKQKCWSHEKGDSVCVITLTARAASGDQREGNIISEMCLIFKIFHREIRKHFVIRFNYKSNFTTQQTVGVLAAAVVVKSHKLVKFA